MKRRYKGLALIVVFMLILAPVVMARTGGAGGGSSSRSSSSSGSGSGGDGLGMLIYWIIVSIPFPYNMIVLAAIFGAAMLYSKNARQTSPYNRMARQDTPAQKKGLDALKKNDPAFSEQEFLLKVRKAFEQINEGWQKKNMSGCRRYISDGIYQRFHAQFEMMNRLEQTNRSEQIRILDLGIDKAETDGYFDAVSVRLRASSTDWFENTKYPELNSGGFEEYTEYWTFLRKRGGGHKDLYRSNACPSCGDQLPQDSSDVSKCPSCGRLSNTGEYDWILAEITQADDYLVTEQRPVPSRLKKETARLTEENDDFCVQLLEDRVSNGYVRVLMARVTRKPEAARRFISDELYAALQGDPWDPEVALNRLYLNYVKLIASGSTEEKNLLAFAVKETSQRIRTGGRRAELLDPRPVARDRIVLLERQRGRSAAAGNVYSYSCPSCGGEIQDSLALSCSYCGEAYNSVSFDWVITRILTTAEYQQYLSEHKGVFESSTEPDLTAALYKTRDYAMNNLMIVISSDGVFKEEEEAFARKAAARWGYNVAKIQALFQMAKSGRLVLRMPESPKDRARIYRLLVKAASSDNEIHQEEQQVLDYVKGTFLS
ncbi:MAG: TIM44-like domain-containing protein [Spirochaetales bacterium]|nr:TIM44-like domain-containing protein [Spirochaetales bacterium]